MSDKLLFADEPKIADEKSSGSRNAGDPEFWHILIVDDEEDIHTLTTMLLTDISFGGRKLKLHSAYSGQEAKSFLSKNPDTALVLLDVMMESDDAGIRLIPVIRNELNNKKVQLVLRTGQPGQAPEREVISNYDINGYYLKTEITSQKLYSILISAIRTYSYIDRLEKNRSGLSKIIEASEHMMRSPSVSLFCNGVLSQFSAILGCTANGIICSESMGTVDSSNKHFQILAAAGSFSHTTGKSLEVLDENNVTKLIHKTVEEKHHQFLPKVACLYVISQTGSEMAIYLSLGFPLSEHDQQMVELFCSRISLLHENLHLFTNIRRMAYYDNLTGLPNKTSFIERLKSFLDYIPSETPQSLLNNLNINTTDETIISEAKPDQAVAILLLGLDKFRDINHTFSHKVGDFILKEVAARLQKGANTWPANNVQIARVGGDRFGILARMDGRPKTVKFLSELLLNVLDAPIENNNSKLQITGSVGFVLSRDEDQSSKAEDLLHQADIAMAQAKLIGRNSIKGFDENYGQNLSYRTQMLQDLRAAISQKELFLCYQPQINCATGGIIGTEALLRWKDYNGSLIPPEEFIPLAEQAGLISSIGLWVLKEAIKRQADWASIANAPQQIAINISAVQLTNPELPSIIEQVLDANNLEPECLEIEVTETAIMSEPVMALECLWQIKELGVDISIDDFGTGTTSMSQLKSIPATKLKIDKSFIAGITNDPGDAAITKSIIQLGKAFDLKVIAEGVETEEQVDFLKSEGCHILQGFFFAKPMKPANLLDFIARYQTT